MGRRQLRRRRSTGGKEKVRIRRQEGRHGGLNRKRVRRAKGKRRRRRGQGKGGGGGGKRGMESWRR
jgi:hypothetical protein